MVKFCCYVPFLLATLEIASAFVMNPHRQFILSNERQSTHIHGNALVSRQRTVQQSIQSRATYTTKLRDATISEPNDGKQKNTPGANNTSKFSTILSHLVTGPNPKRPDWALDWMPTWSVDMRPPVQFLVGIFLYVFHLGVLTQRSIPFPFQLIPNEKGHFQSIGLDS
jgi:hypothetical protein